MHKVIIKRKKDGWMVLVIIETVNAWISAQHKTRQDGAWTKRFTCICIILWFAVLFNTIKQFQILHQWSFKNLELNLTTVIFISTLKSNSYNTCQTKIKKKKIGYRNWSLEHAKHEQRRDHSIYNCNENTKSNYLTNIIGCIQRNRKPTYNCRKYYI